MSRLRVDQVRALLPELDELRPLIGRILSTSAPDPARRWSASGELETVGSRLVRAEEVERGLPTVLEDIARELSAIYAAAARALRALEAEDPVAACEALLEAAQVEERAWRMDRAEAWALAAYGTVQGVRNRRPAALALRRAARAARGRGRLADAAARYQEAHAMSSAEGDHVGAAVAATGRGNVNVDRGLWSDAELWYRRALAHLDASGESLTAERWHVYQNLSIVARRSAELEASRRWLEAAEEIGRALDDPAAAVEVENGWGMWALAAGDSVAAEARFRSALRAAADPKAVVTVSVNLGRALLEQGRTLEAAEVAREAEAEAVRAGLAIKLPELYRLLGDVAAAWENGDAFVFYERALDLVEKEGLPAWERAETLDGYARLREREGREEEATEYRRQADAIRRGLSAHENGGAEKPPNEERA